MKNPIPLFCLLFLIMVYSCGVSEDDYNKLLTENKKLKVQLANLQDQIDVSKLKTDLSFLKNLLEKYNSGVPDEIVSTIKNILSEKNTNKLQTLLGRASGEFILSCNEIVKQNEDFQFKVDLKYDSIAIYDSQISSIKAEIDKLESSGNSYVTFYIKRRFDTDYSTGKGLYECADYGKMRRVILVAYENEVENEGFVNIKKLFVKYLGERSTTVTTTTIYNSSQSTEYFKTYETVSKEKDPTSKKNELKSISNLKNQLELELNEESKLYLIELQNSVLFNGKKLLEILNAI